MPAFFGRAIGSRTEALARDALVHLASDMPTSDGSRLLKLRGLLTPVVEALEVRKIEGFIELFRHFSFILPG